MTSLLSCAVLAATAVTNGNTWLEKWDTPYGIPPFKELKASQYPDALRACSELKHKRIAAIVADKREPDFDNTIVPYIFASKEMTALSRVFGCIYSTDRDAEYEKASVDAIPVFSADGARTIGNRALYERIDAVCRAPRTGLTPEEITILKRLGSSFRRQGIGLAPEKREHLRGLKDRASKIMLEFERNVLACDNEFEKRFGINVARYKEAMATTEDRSRREAMYREYVSRGFKAGEHDNRPVILELTKVRAEMAGLLGYRNTAEFSIEPRMAGTPAAALDFTRSVMKIAVKAAAKELDELKKLFERDVAAGKLPAGSRFEAWDVDYYAEKLRKEKYDFSANDMKPYFKAENVLKGIFICAERLYGIKARKLDDVPLYNEKDVTAYEITDADGSHLCVFYVDYKPRASKSGGAWMALIRNQWTHGNGPRPIVANVCNFGEYLTPAEVKTAFHEFGHALQGLFSQCAYPMASTTEGYPDYIEIFSQINERWAFDPSLLAQYAVNDKGETIPAELVARMKAAENHCAGISAAMLTASALTDLEWHMLESVEGIDPGEFERKISAEAGLPPELLPRHRLAHFRHVFSGGYTAAYYTYRWAQVIDAHIFSVFEKSGDIWNRKLADKFRKTFHEKGCSDDPMKLFRDFTGAEKPDPRHFFESSGLFP